MLSCCYCNFVDIIFREFISSNVSIPDWSTYYSTEFLFIQVLYFVTSFNLLLHLHVSIIIFIMLSMTMNTIYSSIYVINMSD